MDKIIDIDIKELAKKANTFNKIFLQEKNTIDLDAFFKKAMVHNEYLQYKKDIDESKENKSEEISFDYNIVNFLGIYNKERINPIFTGEIQLKLVSHKIEAVYLRLLNGEISKFRIKIQTLNNMNGKNLESDLNEEKAEICLRYVRNNIFGFDFIKKS